MFCDALPETAAGPSLPFFVTENAKENARLRKNCKVSPEFFIFRRALYGH